jgi:Bacterial protein of unknown function (DUF899)
VRHGRPRSTGCWRAKRAHTREGDQIAAARRSLPMVEVDAATPLIGQHGQVPLLNVFEGRRQRRTVEHRTEVIPSRNSASPVASPIRTGNSNARCAASAASTADLGEANAAHTPSPVCLNMYPPCASIAPCSTSSWAASATRIPSASASHRRVEPSTSVNRNVTTPEGAAARSADTTAESHTDRLRPRTSADRSGPVTGYTCFETNFRESQMSSLMRLTWMRLEGWPTSSVDALVPAYPFTVRPCAPPGQDPGFVARGFRAVNTP